MATLGLCGAIGAAGAIVEMGEEKDAGEIRRRRSSGAESKRIQIEVHKKDVAGRISASVLFHQLPMECRKVFEFRADPSKIGVSRIQCGLIDVVERDPSHGTSRDILETVKDKLVLVEEAL